MPMATTRFLLSSVSTSTSTSSTSTNRFLSSLLSSRSHLLPFSTTTTTTTTASSSSRSNPNTNSPASFDWSSSSEDDEADGNKTSSVGGGGGDKSKLPPPYDPFTKKPRSMPGADDPPPDPSNLQEVFHRMRTEGLTGYAAKMFDGLSKDGLTHEALELFSVIKDKGTMPDVVAHTAVLEAYADAGGAHWKDAVRTYDRMLASGVLPNAYTLAVLVRGLAKSGRLVEAKKYLLDMLGRGMRPNVATYVAVLEAHVREEKAEEARLLVEELKAKGFVPDEDAVRANLAKRGHMFRSVMSLLFGK